MAFRDTWHRALQYFGLAEDEQYVDDQDSGEFEPEAELEERYRTREQVRRVGGRRRDEIDDIFAGDSPPGGPQTRVRRRAGTAAPDNPVRGHWFGPRTSTTPSRSPTSSRTRSR